MNIKEYAEMRVKNGSANYLSSVYKELAKGLGLTKQAVASWCYGLTPVTAEHVLKIEKLTGGLVDRTTLRPDIYPADLKINHEQKHLTLIEWINKQPAGNLGDVYADLSKSMNMSKQSIITWAVNSQRVSAEHVLKIEKLTGGLVHREDLRPDIYPADLKNRKYDVPKFEIRLTVEQRLTNIENLLNIK